MSTLQNVEALKMCKWNITKHNL